MTKAQYAELRRDPRWQKRRLEILSLHEFMCASCGDTKTELHVHHLYYVHGRKPWEYPDLALVCLCKDCHSNNPAFIDIAWLEQMGETIIKNGLANCLLSKLLEAIGQSRFHPIDIINRLSEIVTRDELPFPIQALKNPTESELKQIEELFEKEFPDVR